ncbi:MAG: tetratricopeptide repeat protein [Phycisphaerales bacterium]
MALNRSFVRALAAATLPALLLVACAGREQPLASLRHVGDARMGTGQYDQAAASYQEFIDRRPGDPYIRAALGKAYLKNNQPANAVEHLRVAWSQRPQDTDVLNDLCEALVQSGQNDECFRTLRTNAADRGGVDDHMRLGAFAQRMGDNDTARVALLSAAKIDRGRTPAPQLALARFHANIKDMQSAQRRLRMAYWLAPEDTKVLEACRELGAVTGPTFGLYPEERDPAEASVR